MLTHVLLLVSLEAAPPLEPAHPWGPVPSGWVFAEQEGIDSWPGIYHDRVSGVCVQFDVAFPSVVSHLKRGTEALPSGYSGVPARLSLTVDAKCKGGRRLQAAFLPSGEGPHDLIWNVYADTCDDTQLSRARQFLFAPGAGPPRAYPKNPDQGRLHTRAELAAVAEGESYATVRSRLGASSMAECKVHGSFVVSWTEDSKPHYREWEYRFNQSQQLVSKRRR